MDDMKNIVIVTPARSGSSWLVNAFENIYNYNAMPLFLSEGDDYNHELNLVSRIEILRSKKPFVTKVFTDQMIDLTMLQDNKTEFVWLYRKNIIEHFLSNVIAWKTKVYNIHKHETYIPIEDLVITQEEINTYINIVECQNRAYTQYKYIFDYEVSYEELFNNNPWNFRSDQMYGPIKLNQYKQAWIKQAADILNDKGLI